MKHSVRSTLVTLGLGTAMQRVLQLVAFLAIGRALGASGLGQFAAGQALAALLAVLAGTGVRNVLARAIAQQPEAAGALLRTAVRARLLVGGTLLLPALGLAIATTAQPWFWTLCLLQVVPSAFDLKNLLDASGRTGREVALETAVAALQLLLVGIWFASGGTDLAPLAAIALGSRCLYAVGAVQAIRRLPRPRTNLPPATLPRTSLAVSLGQTAHELMAAGDVWLVSQLFGQATAGLYATAVRLAAAALVPSAQLARLLLPHLLRATAAGDPRRTLHTALRSTAFATLPMLAGGAIVAAPLCELCGEQFVAAAPALRLLLLAGCLQHLGWQCSHALFAAGRDLAYAAGLLWPAVLQALLLGAFVGLGDAAGAASAALAMVLAMAGYLAAGLWLLRPALAGRSMVLWWSPLSAGAATALAALLPGLCWAGPFALLLQLAAGGSAFAAMLWHFELRGRHRRFGDGLAAASGFRS